MEKNSEVNRSYGQTHAVGDKIGGIICPEAETVANTTFLRQQMRLP